MISNALTVDVEDYFQVSAFANNIEYQSWDEWPSRVEQNTHKLLQLFEQKQCRGTFFILGWVAERYPQLVKEIERHGHEIASHGYSHQLIYTQTPAVFKEETLKSKAMLEDLIQKPVRGYRAASYSITAQSLWALDILAEAGFEYDSSIFPIRHDRYGMPGVPKEPHRIKTQKGNTLIEFPLSTLQLFGQSIPISGGGYFRLYPYALSQWFLQRYQASRQAPFIFYLHPWEVDPEQPRIESSWLSKFRHYNKLDACEKRLSQLIDRFKFAAMEDTYQAYLAAPDKLPLVNY